VRIRKVKNSAKNTVIQVGYYRGKHFQLVKHIGSAKSTSQEVTLIKQAQDFIHRHQLSLLSPSVEVDQNKLIPLGYCRETAYKYFAHAFESVFPEIKDPILKDLVIIRIIQPTSKFESVQLLQEYFGIKYSNTSVYRAFLKADKQMFVKQLAAYAKEYLSFDFRLLFYDVTTLYFESGVDEDLKLPGFSKDGKHSQPQIMIGLVVDQHGFPLFLSSL
jgi:hypothetical protein